MVIAEQLPQQLVCVVADIAINGPTLDESLDIVVDVPKLLLRDTTLAARPCTLRPTNTDIAVVLVVVDADFAQQSPHRVRFFMVAPLLT